MKTFTNRVQAGKQLGQFLAAAQSDFINLSQEKRLFVLGLARGGLPVAKEVAHELGCEFDAVLVRKLGLPSQPELAFGAISEEGAIWRNEFLIASAGLSESNIAEVLEDQQKELERRVKLYRAGRVLTSIEGKVVILVDDGIATGATMRAAIRFIRGKSPTAIYIAVPVATTHSKRDFTEEVDGFYALSAPEDFGSVGDFYQDFSQVTDTEVLRLLESRKTFF